MRIRLAFIGSSVSSFGFRVLGNIVGRTYPDTSMHFVLAKNFSKLWSILFSHASSRLSSVQIDRIGMELADAEVIGLSCFSEYASLTREIIAAIRRHRPHAFIVWGGVHPTADPDSCIDCADAVAIGEAEVSFPELLLRLDRGMPFEDVPGFWFRRNGTIVRNPSPPLLSSDQLSDLPHPLYGQKEFLFAPDDTVFRPFAVKDYIDLNSLSYNTVWSRGCPFRCSYCGNTRLIEIDRDYAGVRHSKVDHIVAEVQAARTRFPHITHIVFHDDCLISLPAGTLEEFACKWRAQIGLPFAITGVTPAHLREEKVKILLAGGLNRVCMGIRSGSDRILKFYRWPNRKGLMAEATAILGRYAQYMMPPHYDMIFDNPIETKEDIDATLRLINDMPRPFMLNIFSLRLIPNTELGAQLAAVNTDIDSIEQDYTAVMPTFANALMYLCAIVRVPTPMFERLIRRARPYREGTHRIWWLAVLLLRGVFMAKRAYHRFYWRDFSSAFGRIGLLLRRLGFLDSLSTAPNKYPHLIKRTPTADNLIPMSAGHEIPLEFSRLWPPLSVVDADRLAEMHLAQLPGRILPLLGQKYLRAFYRHVVKSTRERAFVARTSGVIVGLCIVTENWPTVLRRMVLATLPSFLWAAVPRFVASSQFRRACLAVLRSGTRESVSPLICMLFTAPEMTGRGVGRRLLNYVAENSDGSEFIFTKTEDEPNNAAIDFYKKNGFEVLAKEVYADRRYLSLRRKIGPSSQNSAMTAQRKAGVA